MKATWKIKDVLDANHLPTPQSRQVHVLVEVPEGVSAPENIRKRKRMEDEDAPDAWIKAIKDEQVAALPATCEDLKEHLKRPLHVKVPVNDRLYYCGVLRDVIDPLGSGSELATEDTYHHLWDSLIAMLLRLVSNGNFRRNTNASTSTGLYRPDLCFYYKNSNICVFRGEEKASGELQVPIRRCTIRFGYAAVGLQVCLVAIRKDEMTERGAKVEMIETYDLGDLHGRLSFFLALLNFSTLFRPVVDLIQPLDILEYGTIERGNGVQISFAEDCVVKTYPLSMPSDDIIRNLRELHRQMKKHSVPNVVELKKTNMKKKYVKLAPVGRLSPPENVRQLLTALRDILKALVALHAINMMHRDLRWENVLKYPGEGNKWFLIDFDEGASSPAAKVNHLKAESHAPELLLSSSHTVKVDIWSVGFLLKTSPFQDFPSELESMKAQCLQTCPSSRPTAKSLLDVIESLIEC
ncbi:Protein kinase-like domain [Phytophthora cactorum]|nr:Protein kinase-like domain [Phytophthora cactorum]